MLLEAALIECLSTRLPAALLWRLSVSMFIGGGTCFKLYDVGLLFYFKHREVLFMVLLGYPFLVWIYTLIIWWIMGLHINFSCLLIWTLYVDQAILLPFLITELFPWLYFAKFECVFTNYFGFAELFLIVWWFVSRCTFINWALVFCLNLFLFVLARWVED